ncbi:PREDICTED: protein BASIC PENTACYSTEINE6-like [Ipomoea nil]|uniref:protein BASIC PENTACYSTEINE6-like n=1 Tax=Ipomoea nil TaxID=35883 RepID=UPI000900BB82|nr:PREDICTED: protein BASIC PENTACYSTEINE6-like [Ipomoea nil]XP_019172235.1 PREDICTED: protein BASIC PENTACYSTEINE6-like [Ipomoea nil]
MMDQNNSTIRTYMAIMAERDAAILERNMALDERKRALAERDMAMLQRDAAIAERNTALEERDNAISALKLRESSMNDEDIVSKSPGAEHIHYQQEMHEMISAAAYDPTENLTNDPFNVTDPTPQTANNPRKVRQPKESKPKKASKLARVVKREEVEVEDLSWQAVSTFDDWDDGNCGEFVDASDEEQDKHLDTWDEDFGLEQVNSDVSAMPVPVCSCTGTPQPCYKWGNGGWQSACCTTTISMYPLPQASHKRYSRVGGRKMSASAFSKLLSRLTAEGYDLSAPLDLKDHWAKHGTNRYSTVK